MIFKHIKTGYTLDRLKFSANEQNSTYFYGSNPNQPQVGVPDIMYDELVFCRERRIIYTHGAFYTNAVEGSYLKQIEDLTTYTPKATDGEIVEYTGETDEDYVNGYLYKYIVTDQSVPVRRILTTSNSNILQQGDKFSFKENVYGIIAYVDNAKQYYCYENPEIEGTKVYKIGNPVTEYKVTSSTRTSTGVQAALESLVDHTTIVVTLKNVSKELWVNSEGRSVYACTGKTFTGMVQVNGDMYVYITSKEEGDRTNYWKQIIPDTITSGTGGFKKLIVGNSEINSFDQSTITVNAGVGIKLENTSRGIIISRLTEINDNLTDSGCTWSSEKISSVINSINTNNFVVVDQLPTVDIDPNVIYIVPKQGATSPDQKEEYIYVNGQWELVGSMSVNLDDYYTRGEVDNKLDRKQNVLTAVGKVSIVDNIISVDLSAYYTKDDIDRALSIKQDLISGSEGEVAYLSESGIVSQTIMSDGYVVDTQADLDTCKNSSPSFDTVFRTWRRFSHKGSVDDFEKDKERYPNSDYNKWTYIPSLDTVSQPNNSAAYTGFISPKSYSNYDITVRVYSDNGDDDFIGMVAAYAKDSNGKEHTLSFLRTTNGTGINFTDCGWVCMLDFRAQSSKSQIGVDGLQILANKNSVFLTRNTNWAAVNASGASNGGTTINITRTGNVFTAKCSEFGTTELLNNSLITIDLNNDTLTTRFPILNLFKGSSPWGYSTYSQANSRYQNISITDPNNMIFDLVHDKVLLYNTSSKSWEEKPGYTPIKSVGVGRFSYNTITDKLFYNDGISINRVSTTLTAGDNITITKEGVISARVNASANNGKLTIKQGDTTLGSFNADQATDTTVTIPNFPAINDGTLTIKQGITQLGTFNANQSGNTEINIPVPTEPNNGTLTVKKGGTSLGTFKANQAGNTEIEIPSTPASNYDIKDLTDSTNLKQTWSGKQDPISGTGVISVNNNVVSADLSSYDTTAQVDQKLATKQNTLTGNNGDVMYHNGTSIIPQQIMSPGYVVNTAADLASCKNSKPSFKDVFETWKMFSHQGATDNASADDMSHWSYDSTINTIKQSKNSDSYNGFISPRSYSGYDIKIRVYSNNTDDDVIGLVAAFAKDSNGKEHTLSFLRTGGGVGSANGHVVSWACVLDDRGFGITSTGNGQTLLVDNTLNSGYLPLSTPGVNTISNAQGWAGLGTGSVIRIVRTGNVFEAWCSEFGSLDLIPESKITIDLDALSTTYPALNLFKGASPWGYSTISQANSMYENISITDDNLIYDLVNTVVWTYDPGQATWVTISGADPISAMGVGRLNFNNITNKLFYNNGSRIEELSASSSSVTPANDSTITLTQGGTTVGDFTLNQSTNKTIDLPAPATYTAGDAININSSTGNSVNVLYDNSSITLNSSGKLQTRDKIQLVTKEWYDNAGNVKDNNTLYLIMEIE